MKNGTQKFKLISVPNRNIGGQSEYLYKVFFKSLSGKVYESSDNWHSWGKSAKEAKDLIFQRIVDLGIIDYLLEDVVINDSWGNPRFLPA